MKPLQSVVGSVRILLCCLLCHSATKWVRQKKIVGQSYELSYLENCLAFGEMRVFEKPGGF